MAYADVFFSPGTAVLSDADIAKILKPIEVVKSRNTVTLYIAIGHTDKTEVTGSKAHLLSLARAGAVVSHVLRAHPELKDVLHIEGKASTQPASNDPSKNRRVEIQVGCVVLPPYFDKSGNPIL